MSAISVAKVTLKFETRNDINIINSLNIRYLTITSRI